MSDKKPAVPTAYTVRKAVEAIAINPKSGRITLLTRKLFNVLLYQAQRQGEALATYRAPLADIVATAEFDSNDTNLIKEHLRKMLQTQVEWNSTSEDGSRRWGATNILSEAEIIEDKKSRRVWVEWSYAPKIKKRLLEPDIYARLSLQFQSSLRSSAALGLYEICSRYAESPAHLTMRNPWQWWRPVLTGIPDGSPDGDIYPEYKYFKRSVLKGAVSEVNAVTDLEVELIEHKDGRRITDIQFRSMKKAQSGLPLPEPALFDMALVARMKAIGLPQHEVEQLYCETEENVIRATLDALAARQANRKAAPLTSPAAWFKTMLKTGAAAKSALVEKKPAAKPKVTTQKVREKYIAHQREQAMELYREMMEDDQLAAIDRFRDHLAETGNAVTLQEFDKKGMKSKIAEVAFTTWLAQETWGEPTEKDLLEFVLELGGALS